MKKTISYDLGIFAHNEEANIGAALKSVCAASQKVARLKQIVVVSSGSFDATNRIVRDFMRKEKRIILVTELERQGKSSAINLFLKRAKAEVVVTMSADLKLHKAALDEICEPFFHEGVGMVGAHPEPRELKESELGQEIKLLWELHHEISMITPKCGEMVAFRNVIRAIPPESAVDEATIEVLLKLVGYSVVYAPRAMVYNRGPKTKAEYIKQRRRVYAGHEWIWQRYGYKVVTMEPQNLLKVVLLKWLTNPKSTKTLISLIKLEIMARFLGFIDYKVLRRNPYIWPMISRD